MSFAAFTFIRRVNIHLLHFFQIHLHFFFIIICGFLQNSRKYRLGSLRKIPAEGTPSIVLGPQINQSDLHLQPNPTHNFFFLHRFQNIYGRLLWKKILYFLFTSSSYVSTFLDFVFTFVLFFQIKASITFAVFVLI